MLQSAGSQRVERDLETEQQQRNESLLFLEEPVWLPVRSISCLKLNIRIRLSWAEQTGRELSGVASTIKPWTGAQLP